MRASILISILWLFPGILISQTNISGIINTYHKVTGIDYVQSGVKLDDVTGIVMGDRVMIIQMKGATVNTTVNSNSFGSLTNLNDAGNYELATVCAVKSDSVFFIQQLLQTYSINDKVQLVKIPRYTSSNVTGTLEASLWDSTSGKGGVLALIVSGTLELNAPVSATAKGFKGGLYYKDGGGCATNAFQNYAYDPTPAGYLFYSNVQRGGWKGESIADLSLSLSGGRGAAANGGGGGNNHNNGGGGGSNLAVAGKGGDNQSTTGCMGSFAGIGGYALSSNGGEKFFLGGGGGAGHGNNTTTSSGGGYGGGIIFIQAQSLVSNGYTISATGGTGGNTIGDGAAGGGGGGSIILSIDNYLDNISVQVRGGDGGIEDDEIITGRCYGEGGGGSGGVVYFSGTLPAGTVNLSGGSRGAKLNSTCATTTGANGSAGIQEVNYDIMESGTASSCAGILLSDYWKLFRITASGNEALVHWAVAESRNSKFLVERKANNNWMAIASIEAIANQLEYFFRDSSLPAGTYQYRVKSINNQTTSISPVKQITIYRKQQEILFDPLITQLLVKGIVDKEDVLQIFDLTGKCIYQKRMTVALKDWHLNVSFLQTGVYIAKTQKAVSKFIVTHH